MSKVDDSAETLEALLAAKGNVSLDRCKSFLNGLRETGVTNMLGAAPYLTKHLKVSKKLAGRVLVHWMQTFGQ